MRFRRSALPVIGFLDPLVARRREACGQILCEPSTRATRWPCVAALPPSMTTVRTRVSPAGSVETCQRGEWRHYQPSDPRRVHRFQQSSAQRQCARRAGPSRHEVTFAPGIDYRRRLKLREMEVPCPRVTSSSTSPGLNRSNAAFSRASSVIQDGSSLERRTRRVETVRDAFETVRPNDQHAGW